MEVKDLQLGEDKNLLVKVFIGLMVCVSIWALAEAVLAYKGWRGASGQYPIYINIDGQAELKATPDTAQFSFNIEEKGTTVSEAQKKVNDKISAVLTALKDLGVSDKDIKTASYNITPDYVYEQPPVCTGLKCPAYEIKAPKIVGYIVTQATTLNVKKIDDAGKALELIGSTNVNNLSGPNFVTEDMDAINQELKLKAIENAKANAEQVAKSLGVKLVRVTGYNNGDYPAYATPVADVMYSKASAAPMAGESINISLPSGENKYQAKATLTFEVR